MNSQRNLTFVQSLILHSDSHNKWKKTGHGHGHSAPRYFKNSCGLLDFFRALWNVMWGPVGQNKPTVSSVQHSALPMGTFQADLLVFSPLTSSDTALTKLTSACDFSLTEQCAQVSSAAVRGA